MKTKAKGVMAMALLASLAALPDDSVVIRAANFNEEGVRLVRNQDYNGALKSFREALAISPACVSAARNAGKILIMSMKYKEAMDMLEPTLKAVPDDPGCLVQMVQASALAGDTAKSVRHVERLAEISDKSVLRGLTVQLVRQGSLKEAAVASELSVEKEPGNPEAWFNRGLVGDAVQNAKIAGESYERAVSLDPDYSDAWVNLGNVHKRENDDKRMFACYEKAYLAKKCPLSAFSLGRELVARRKDVSRGLDLLEEAADGDDEAARQARAFIKRMTDRLCDKKGVAK